MSEKLTKAEHDEVMELIAACSEIFAGHERSLVELALGNLVAMAIKLHTDNVPHVDTKRIDMAAGFMDYVLGVLPLHDETERLYHARLRRMH